MNIKLNPIIFNMVGFLFIQALYLRVATRSGWLKAPDPKQMGACNQEKKILSNLHTVGCTPHPLLVVGALANLKSLHKCALWESKGSNPLQVHCGHKVGLLNCHRCGRCVLRALDPPPSSLRQGINKILVIRYKTSKSSVHNRTII